MESFVYLCKQGSYTKAAEGLFITQSALSKRIANMEAELGLALVERRGGVVVPSKAGEALLARCEEGLKLRDDTLREMEGIRTGIRAPLRVGYLPTTPLALMAPAVSRMSREHSETSFSFSEISGLADPCDEIRRGRLDVAITLEENARRQALVGVKVFRRMRYCVLAGTNHPFAHRASCAPGDLAGQHIVLFTSNNMQSYHTMARYLVSSGCEARDLTYVGSHSEMILLVCTGKYLCLSAIDIGLPEEQVPEEVVRIPLAGCKLTGGDMVVAYDTQNAAACAFANML